MKKIVEIREDFVLGYDVVFRILNNDNSDSPDYFFMEETEEMKKRMYGNGYREEVDELSLGHFDIKPGDPVLKVQMAMQHDIENTFGSVQQLP